MAFIVECRQVADDGHPIEVVRYNWEISSLELLCKIRDVVKRDHKGVAAKSFTFMVPFAYGTRFQMPYMNGMCEVKTVHLQPS